MSATTIKLDGKLVSELMKVKPRAKSISAYVRDLIEGDVRRHALAASARRYQEFLASNPTEEKWLGEWMEADLARAPRTRRS